uniref:PDZ domain-containing protein n=1 Tax=Glossina brevipalpis TaxID=37001 RepID=A0A1A9WR78_9MUSC
MATPIEEKVDQNLKQIRTGMVNVSDGKCKPEPLRLNLTMELLTLQRLEIVTPTNPQNGPPSESKERMVQITRQKQGGLGLSIKGGAEHKLPILISRIYKDQAADITGQLFVGDAIIKVNGEYITACPHDDAVNILRNAGDIVVLTVKHYRAATPFLQKQLAKDTPDSDNDTTCAELKADEGYKSSVNNGGGGTISRSCSRPMSICSEPEKRWMDVVAVPLMMAYVTRYIYGTDKLRPNAFEVRGINGTSTGIIHCDDLAILSQWLKLINDNVVGLTHLQMKLYNRNFAVGERIEYMGWVNEGVINNNISWQSYKPRFLLLKGTEVMLFETPPANAYKDRLAMTTTEYPTPLPDMAPLTPAYLQTSRDSYIRIVFIIFWGYDIQIRNPPKKCVQHFSEIIMKKIASTSSKSTHRFTFGLEIC